MSQIQQMPGMTVSYYAFNVIVQTTSNEIARKHPQYVIIVERGAIMSKIVGRYRSKVKCSRDIVIVATTGGHEITFNKTQTVRRDSNKIIMAIIKIVGTITVLTGLSSAILRHQGASLKVGILDRRDSTASKANSVEILTKTTEQRSNMAINVITAMLTQWNRLNKKIDLRNRRQYVVTNAITSRSRQTPGKPRLRHM